MLKDPIEPATAAAPAADALVLAADPVEVAVLEAPADAVAAAAVVVAEPGAEVDSTALVSTDTAEEELLLSVLHVLPSLMAAQKA